MMSDSLQLVADCPRCSAQKTTFDVCFLHPKHYHKEYIHYLEVPSICRSCEAITVFNLTSNMTSITMGRAFKHVLDIPRQNKSLDKIFELVNYVSTRNMNARTAPEHTPEDVKIGFDEGAQSLLGGCANAAAAMFRACLDVATKNLLPKEITEGLNDHVRKNLAPRLEWLFATDKLPKRLEPLSRCVRNHGNDGVHDLDVSKEDAKFLEDFTYMILEDIFTRPANIDIMNKKHQKIVATTN